MMIEMRRLRDEHDALVVVAGLLGRHIEGEFPADPVGLVDFHEQRTRLRNLLIAHLKREDWVLYPTMLQSGDRQLADTARAFIEEMGHIAAAFSDYSRRWMPDAITADWPGYCAETKAILTALAARIDRENDRLYPLAELAEPVTAVPPQSADRRHAALTSSAEPDVQSPSP